MNTFFSHHSVLAVALLMLSAGGCRTLSGSGFHGFPATGVPAPPAVPSAKPVLDKAGESAVTVDNTNRELAARVVTLKAEAANARAETTKAVERARLLAEKGAATKAELEDAWHALQTLESRNLFLEKESENLDTTVKRQASEISDLRKSVSDAQAAEAAVEQERDVLRDTLAVANARLEVASAAIAKQTDRATKAEVRASQANVYRRWIVFGAIGFAALWLIREIVPRLIRP